MSKPETKFIVAFLLASACILGGVITISILIDPRGLFGTSKFTPLVLPSRPAKVALIKNFEPSPEILIFGGSSINKLDPEKIKELTWLQAFNLGVNNARTEDFLAFFKYELYDLRIKPRFIIIAFHPESFDSNRINPQTIHMTVLRRQLSIGVFQYLDNLISILRENLTLQYLYDVSKTMYYIVRGYPPMKNSYRADGYSLSRNDGRTIDEYFKKDHAVIINHIKDDYGNGTLSEMRQRYFESFLDLAKQNNIKVAVALLPFHPKILSLLREIPEFNNIHKQLDTYIKDVKKKYQADYYDFTDISSFGGDENDFDDLVHPVDKNSELMLKIILADFKKKLK